MLAKGSIVVVLAASVIAGTSAAAIAKTGSVANARSVVFYYGEQSGEGKSDFFKTTDGVRLVAMCANSDGGSRNTYVAQYYNYNTGPIPDKKLKDANISYASGVYKSAYFNINDADRYYTKATWSAVPSLPNDYQGYVATRNAYGSCS